MSILFSMVKEENIWEQWSYIFSFYSAAATLCGHAGNNQSAALNAVSVCRQRGSLLRAQTAERGRPDGSCSSWFRRHLCREHKQQQWRVGRAAVHRRRATAARTAAAPHPGHGGRPGHLSRRVSGWQSVGVVGLTVAALFKGGCVREQDARTVCQVSAPQREAVQRVDVDIWMILINSKVAL